MKKYILFSLATLFFHNTLLAQLPMEMSTSNADVKITSVEGDPSNGTLNIKMFLKTSYKKTVNIELYAIVGNNHEFQNYGETIKDVELTSDNVWVRVKLKWAFHVDSNLDSLRLLRVVTYDQLRSASNDWADFENVPISWNQPDTTYFTCNADKLLPGGENYEQIHSLESTPYQHMFVVGNKQTGEVSIVTLVSREFQWTYANIVDDKGMLYKFDRQKEGSDFPKSKTLEINDQEIILLAIPFKLDTAARQIEAFQIENRRIGYISRDIKIQWINPKTKSKKTNTNKNNTKGTKTKGGTKKKNNR